MNLTDGQKTIIMNHVTMNHATEWCGVILCDGSIIPMSNVAKQPQVMWEFDAIEWASIANLAAALIHSHVATSHSSDIRTPSRADLKCQRDFGLPMLICGFSNNRYYECVQIPPPLSNQYLNRKFIYCVADCAVIVRDFYYFEMGVKINFDPMLALAHRNEQEQNMVNALVDNDFEEYSLNSVKRLEVGDILLTGRSGARRNHTLIVYDDNFVLDQSEVSKLVPISEIQNQVQGGVWRYKY